MEENLLKEFLIKGKPIENCVLHRVLLSRQHKQQTFREAFTTDTATTELVEQIHYSWLCVLLIILIQFRPTFLAGSARIFGSTSFMAGGRYNYK